MWALAATEASAANIANAGHAVRWFAFFLRTQHPGQGRTARDVGRTGVVACLQWLAQRARDSTDFRRLEPDDPRRSVIGERLLPMFSATERLFIRVEDFELHLWSARCDRSCKCGWTQQGLEVPC